MTPQRPNSIFSGITWHLVVAMVILAAVLALGGSVAFGLSEPSHVLMLFVISVLAVALAGALAIGSLIFADAEPVERAVNGLVQLLSPRKSASTGFEGLVGMAATLIEPFARSEGRLRGRVRLGAEIWSAELDENADTVLGPGDRVEVVGQRGLILVVTPITSDSDSAGAAY